jgi:hypothetical protein
MLAVQPALLAIIERFVMLYFDSTEKPVHSLVEQLYAVEFSNVHSPPTLSLIKLQLSNIHSMNRLSVNDESLKVQFVNLHSTKFACVNIPQYQSIFENLHRLKSESTTPLS